jgi:hypothetical protein
MPTPLVVGAGPVIRALCEEIGLVEAVNQTVAWDPQRCHLSPGERIFALIVNLLTARQPLYRVHEPFQLTDVPLLLGSGHTAADFTDDALGRALDKVAAAGGATVFSAVATRALLHDHVWTPDHPVFVHWIVRLARSMARIRTLTRPAECILPMAIPRIIVPISVNFF